jgi:GMP synthase (glutamine-hydrolysing)
LEFFFCFLFFFKDEVRELGQKLGLPREMVWRQPFPGPGLSVRIICTDSGYFPANYSATCQQLQDFVASQQQKESSSSSFSCSSSISAILLPIQTVGVQGDERSYGYGVALSGAVFQDKEKKEGGLIDWASLFRLAHLIPKHIHSINRCVFVLDDPTQPIYDQKFLLPLPQQPLGPGNITPTTMIVEVIEQVRQADRIANELLQRHELTQSISQMPVILFPVCFSGAPEETGFRSIALRPFITNDFMTGTAAIPGKDIPESLLLSMARRIKKEVPGISRVVLDLTSKPPGTTEWE